MAMQVSEDVVRTAEAVFREFLRQRRLKYTPERAEMVRAVMRHNEHFEAEQLLRVLRQAGVRVGKATVYRTLKLLVLAGIVKEVQFSAKQTHYEHTYGQGPHDHMVCRRCRRIIEFDAEDVVRLRGQIAARRGFHAVAHRFQIIGLCETCVKNCPVGAAAGRSAP